MSAGPGGAPPLRVGVVGYGLAGRVFHAPLVTRTPGLTLAAVATGNAERAAQVADRYPGARVVARAEALWEGPDAVDVVVVASPNATHAALAAAALDAGRHVVVDKPVAPTAAEVRALADRARRAGRLLVPFQNRRWDGDFLTVRRLVADGALGTVHRFESRFDRWRPGGPRAAWKDDPAAGGLLLDIGAHLVDQALALFGPVADVRRDVYGEVRRLRAGGRADDDWFLALTHASGVVSHLAATLHDAAPGLRFRVLGSAGAYEKRGLDPQEAQLGAGLAPGDAGYGEEPAGAWGALTLGTPDGAGAARPVPTEPGAYGAFYAAVRDAALGVGPPPVTPEEAALGLDVLEAARGAGLARSTALTGFTG